MAHHRNPYRDTPTADLLAARECVAWDRADVAHDPAGWDFPEQTAAFLAVTAEAIEAELTRRERLRAHPLAPPGPIPGTTWTPSVGGSTWRR